MTVDEGTARHLLSRPTLGAKLWEDPLPPPPIHGKAKPKGRIIVVGLGPSGLFAALQLAREGYSPLVVERGLPVPERTRDVEDCWEGEAPKRESNVAFGEGGAGTFSDGKLTCRNNKDPRIHRVFDEFIEAGAPEEIAFLAKPHIGTDMLRDIVQTLRRKIERLGGEVRFATKLKSLAVKNGAISSVTLEKGGREEPVPCAALLLCIGQAARDTYRMLFDKGVAMAAKPFAVGVRAEHPQGLIDDAQYGPYAGHPRLGAADYRLLGRSGERSVYSFCMCPGGRVICAATEAGQIVTNGMSYYARDEENANAAIVAQVSPEDFGSEPLDGLRFMEKLERDAFLLGGSDGSAPASRLEDFMLDRCCTHFGSVEPSFRPGVTPVRLSRCLPDFLSDALREGFLQFEQQLHGYCLPDAVLTAVESRTSSPLRITRGENMCSVSHAGLYPVGEGAGYAGGIVSASVDGIKAAEAVMALYKSGCGAE